MRMAVLRYACLGWLVLGVAWSAQAIELQGEAVQGGMLWGETAPEAEVRLDGESLTVSDDGLFVFGFDRDAGPSATLEICGGGECRSRTLEIVQREYDIQHIEGVPPETVTPPAEVLERIRDESARLRRARSQSLSRQDFSEEFIWPLHGRITGVFGSQRVYNGEPRRPHYGVDIARPTGTTVVAPAPGVVTLTHDDMFFSGGTLVIDHGQGISSTFIHLSRILVEDGQEVAQGDPIAEVGATGRATGPHLDWRMNWFNQRLDPQLLVGSMPSPNRDE